LIVAILKPPLRLRRGSGAYQSHRYSVGGSHGILESRKMLQTATGLSEPTTFKILKSNRRVAIRLSGPADGERLRLFFRSLSPAARYNRFMRAIPEAPAGLVERLAGGDPNGALSLLAEGEAGGKKIVVGEACYVADGAKHRAELALAVADEWQSDRLGSCLLRRLEALAARSGICQLFGDTLGSNVAAQKLVHKAGFDLRWLGDGLIRVEKDLSEPRCRAGFSNEHNAFTGH
jgi:GNAT superfamily N-acetyltransferase